MLFNTLILYLCFSLSVLCKTNSTGQGKAPGAHNIAFSSDSNISPSMSVDPSIIASYHQPTGIIQKDDIPDSVREETCQNQQTFCDNVCGEIQSFASVNECSLKDFKWRCYCDNGIQPSTTNYTFPAEFVACTESIRSCQLRCGSNASCSIGCANSKNCTVKDKNDGKNSSKNNINNASSKQPSLFSYSTYINPMFYIYGLLAALFLLI